MNASRSIRILVCLAAVGLPCSAIAGLAADARPELPGPPIEVPASPWRTVGLTLAAGALVTLGLRIRRARRGHPAPEHDTSLDPLARERERLLRLEQWQPDSEDEAAAFGDAAISLTRELLVHRAGAGRPGIELHASWTTPDWLTWLGGSTAVEATAMEPIGLSLELCDRARFARRIPDDVARRRLVSTLRDLLESIQPPADTRSGIVHGGTGG